MSTGKYIADYCDFQNNPCGVCGSPPGVLCVHDGATIGYETKRDDSSALRTRLSELETTIAEQRRVGRALAARVRREGGYATHEDQAVLREAEHVFGREP